MDLWTEASTDVEGEQTALRMAHAKVAVAGLWPFLTLAQSKHEFEHRLALASDHIANAVPVDLLHPIAESLREDFASITAAKDAEGEEEPDDEDDGKPDWLKKKIDKSSGREFFHAGLGRWEALGFATNPIDGSGKLGEPPAAGMASPGGAPGGSMAGGVGTGSNVPQGPEQEAAAASATRETNPAPMPSDRSSSRSITGPGGARTGGLRHSHAWTGYAGDPEPDPGDRGPSRHELAGEEYTRTRAGTHRPREEDDDPEEAAYWRSLGDHVDKQAAYWHAGRRAWVTAADDNPGGGNPHYFDGGPEAGPATGMTNQFAPSPTQDPTDPINVQYPLNPSPWTVPPGGEWKEEPMQFNPPRKGSRMAVAVGDTDRCTACKEPVKFVQNRDGDRWWSHTGAQGWQFDDHHTPQPQRYAHQGAQKAATEGVVPTPGQNPNYFAGGGEGMTGDPQSGFVPDVAQGVDPEDWVNEAYGAQPLSAGTTDYGNHVAFQRAATTPHHPAPDSDLLQGTEFDSPQERERWNNAQDGEQQDSRASSTFSAARHGFYDPNTRVRFTAGFMDDLIKGQPSAGAGGGSVGGQAPGGSAPGAGGMGPLDEAARKIRPQTTPPRQLPGGGGGGGGGAGSPPPTTTSSSDDAAKQNGASMGTTGMRRTAEGETYERPTQDDPTGAGGDEYVHNTWSGPIQTRPRQGPEHRKINTPQQPQAPIPTIGSPGPANDDGDDDRREAVRVATRVVRELVRA